MQINEKLRVLNDQMHERVRLEVAKCLHSGGMALLAPGEGLDGANKSQDGEEFSSPPGLSRDQLQAHAHRDRVRSKTAEAKESEEGAEAVHSYGCALSFTPARTVEEPGEESPEQVEAARTPRSEGCCAAHLFDGESAGFSDLMRTDGADVFRMADFDVATEDGHVGEEAPALQAQEAATESSEPEAAEPGTHGASIEPEDQQPVDKDVDTQNGHEVIEADAAAKAAAEQLEAKEKEALEAQRKKEAKRLEQAEKAAEKAKEAAEAKEKEALAEAQRKKEATRLERAKKAAEKAKEAAAEAEAAERAAQKQRVARKVEAGKEDEALRELKEQAQVEAARRALDASFFDDGSDLVKAVTASELVLRAISGVLELPMADKKKLMAVYDVCKRIEHVTDAARGIIIKIVNVLQCNTLSNGGIHRKKWDYIANGFTGEEGGPDEEDSLKRWPRLSPGLGITSRIGQDP